MCPLIALKSHCLYQLMDGFRHEHMSIRNLLAGFAIALALLAIGCRTIERSATGLKGVRWLKIAFGVVCAGIIPALFRSWAPPFFSVIIPHLAVFLALVLFHQAVNDVLELNQRYLSLSAACGLALLSGLIVFAGGYANVEMRILTIDSAEALQATLSVLVLFRFRNSRLRSPVRLTGYLMACIVVIHLFRIVLTTVQPPQNDLTELSAGQAFILFLNFTLGLSAGLSLIWVAICRQRNQLHALMLTDGLTGLLNRRAFEEILELELADAQVRGRETGLVLVDLDFFKSINDEHGHSVGDEVIRRISSTLQSGARASDAVGRLGGDEFIIMLRDTSLPEASTVAERIRQQVQSLKGLRLTVSVGLAISSATDVPESLLKKADEALYNSKRSGRNLVTSHTAQIGWPLRRRSRQARSLWCRARSRRIR
jgi:diguanylate cyclase (GGDEF)-like protein